jgi:hypothetical protein
VHIDRLHHGPPAAEHCALVAHDRPSAGDDRDIGRRATHVRNGKFREMAEKPGAHDARRRSRQHRLHRILERNLRTYQRAITPHDHDRR